MILIINLAFLWICMSSQKQYGICDMETIVPIAAPNGKPQKIELTFTENDGAYLSKFNGATNTWDAPVQVAGLQTAGYAPLQANRNSLSQYGIGSADMPSQVYVERAQAGAITTQAGTITTQAGTVTTGQGRPSTIIELGPKESKKEDDKKTKGDKKDDKKKRDKNLAGGFYLAYAIPAFLLGYIIM